MLVNSKKILVRAQAGKYAVPAFNVASIEMMKAVAGAALKLKSPMIIQTSPGAIKYFGADYFVIAAKHLAKQYPRIPIVLHLDHGTNFELCKRCIYLGYTSVMIDGSHLPYQENIKLTKKVVEYARKFNVSVEAELGVLAGEEEVISSEKNIYTDPDQAFDFIKKTGVDSLAIAIGTSHGVCKFKGDPKLDFNRLELINKKARIPLVLHGSSIIEKSAVAQAKKLGLKIKAARGVPLSAIKKAIKLGVAKINFDSDLQLAGYNALLGAIKKKKEEFKLYKLFSPIGPAIQKTAEKRIRLLGSHNKT